MFQPISIILHRLWQLPLQQAAELGRQRAAEIGREFGGRAHRDASLEGRERGADRRLVEERCEERIARLRGDIRRRVHACAPEPARSSAEARVTGSSRFTMRSLPSA